jgi:hypothetical protein
MNRFLMLPICLLVFSIANAAQDSYILWSGGVGLEEREQAPANGTRLVFIDSTGDYLSNINVTVRQPGGPVLVNTTAPGPFLVLGLPQGRYIVRAERSPGNAQGGYLTVDASSREYVYMFPAD